MYFDMAACDKWTTGCKSCPQCKKYSWFFDRSRKLYQAKKDLLEGLDLTVSELTARGLNYAGVYPDSADRGRATMLSISGVKVAVLAYTYGLSDEGANKTDGDSRGVLTMPSAADMVRDITQARVDGANLVVVLPHWGTKNKTETADTVRRMARQLAEAGADVILGTHPNVPQGTERMTVTRADGLEYDAVVCYSLGVLLTDARTAENTAGMIAKLRVTHDPVSRRTTLGDLEAVPIYIARQREEGNVVYRVVHAADETAVSALTQDEQNAAREAAASVRRIVQPDIQGGHG